jgi:hypothetical protein
VPTTEIVTAEIYRRLERFPGARLEGVRVEETSKNSFEISGLGPTASFGGAGDMRQGAGKR